MPDATDEPRGAGRACLRRRVRERACGCSMATTGFRLQETLRPAGPRSSSGWPNAFRTAPATSPCSTWGRRGCRATSSRSCDSLHAGVFRWSSTRTASHIRVGRARKPRLSTVRCAVRCWQQTMCSIRAGSARKRPTSSSASRSERGRSSTTQSIWTTFPRRSTRRLMGPSSCSAGTRPRRTA